MKLIILTSSIFYLLGLKLTHQVQIDQPSGTDSITIIAPDRKPKLPDIKGEEQELPVFKEDHPDSINSCGSNEKTAPWYPLIEDLDEALNEA